MVISYSMIVDKWNLITLNLRTNGVSHNSSVSFVFSSDGERLFRLEGVVRTEVSPEMGRQKREHHTFDFRV